MDTCTLLFTTLLTVTVMTVRCQITTPCTLSMIAGFTPCVNYLTGSSANGRLPSGSCCDAMESLMTTSMDCTCFIVTGNVPFSLPSPINQVLAILLSQACNSQGMALQCKATGVSLPPPGPMLFAPPPPKAFAPIAYSPQFPPIPSETTTEVSITVSEASDPRVASEIRPMITASSSSNRMSISSTLVLFLTLAYHCF